MLKGIGYRWIDCGIAGEHLVLRATEMGIGTCWIGWFKEKRIKDILDIPRRVRIVSLVAAGYPREGGKVPEKRRRPLGDILSWDAWRNA